MAIKVADNTKKIEQHIDSSIALIEHNAQNGIPTTELYVPKHISREIKKGIEEIFNNDGTKYRWLIVKREIHPLTGMMGDFISNTFGDERYFKIKIL